jgi:hypothetical protein
MPGVVVGALVLLLAGQVPDQDDYVQSTGKKCGMDGTASSTPGKTLNQNKNRWNAPPAEAFDDEVTLAALLLPGDDVDRFNDKKAAKISGYVVGVKVGGKETCNCEAAAPVDRDTHIELALSKDATEIQRVIVEVTPRLRAQMNAKGVNWSTAALQRKLKGKWITVSGWLLFDTMHIKEAENTNPGGDKNWRATCWEIHPITAMDVMDAPPADAALISQKALKAMHGTHARLTARDAAKRAALQKRNEEMLEEFDEAEREEEKDHPEE